MSRNDTLVGNSALYGEKKYKNLPNYLTICRILVTPLLIYFLYSPDHNYIATAIFIIAAISDLLDGYIARKYQLESVTGKLLDPLADKILISAVLIMLCYRHCLYPWLVILLLSREFAVTGLRAVAASYQIIIPADIWGKIKTNLQYYGIIGLILNCKFRLYGVGEIDLYFIGYILFILSIVLALYSMVNYYICFQRSLAQKDLQKHA